MTWAEVWAIPRVPGDDNTDHIVRHAYGIDPDKEYRGAVIGGAAPRPAARSVRAPARAPATRKPRATAPARKPASARLPHIVLDRGVSAALSEAPDLGVRITSLVQKHVRSGKAQSRHRLIGFPLVITTTRRGVRVFFDL